MKKNISVVSKGLVIDVGRFRKSHVDDWVGIYSKSGEVIGGFNLLDTKLKVISKHKVNDSIYLLYSIIDRKEEK